jgi:aldehyde:ferredoxin oxidoreductase
VAVKNVELPAHMPQVKRSLAVVYAVLPFGADHQSSEHDPGYTPGSSEISLHRMADIGLTDPQDERAMNREKANLALRTMWNYSFMDSANLCQFVHGPSWQLFGPKEMAELASAATGWDISIEEMQRIGERRLNLLRAFNAREGAGRAQDVLPDRLYDVALRGGASDGVRLTRDEVAAGLGHYYELAGWDVGTGNPSAAKLCSLGLDWLA